MCQPALTLYLAIAENCLNVCQCGFIVFTWLAKYMMILEGRIQCPNLIEF